MLNQREFISADRLAGMLSFAEQVFGDAELANAWLRSPKQRLGGAAPAAYAADTLGFEAVQAWLHEIDQGWLA